MTPAQARELMGLYFGPGAVEQFDPLWPETMLGLSPAMTDRATIEGALQQRLAVIRAHPTGSGPLARQLTSAMQSVADQMIRLYTPEGQVAESTPAPGRPIEQPVDMLGAASAPPPPRRPAPPRPTRELTGLEADASRLLMQHGRVDFAVVQQLTAIAQAKGLPASAVGTALANLASHSPIEVPDDDEVAQPRARSSGARPAPYSSKFDLPEPNAADIFIKRALIVAGVGVFFVVVTLVALLLNSGGGGTAKPGSPTTAPGPAASATPSSTPPRGPNRPTAAPPAAASAPTDNPAPTAADSPAGASPKTLKKPEQPAAPAAPPDAANVLRDLRKAAETARDQPAEADLLFTGAVRAFKSSWPKYEASYRQAMLDSVTEYILRVGDDPARATSALTEVLPASPMIDSAGTLPALGAADVWPAIWSSGMLVRLSRERNLPPAALQRVEEALDQALGSDRPTGSPTFNSGIILGVRLCPARMLPALKAPAAVDPDPAIREPAIADIVGAFANWEEAARAAASVALDPATAERGAAELVLDGIETVLRNAPDPLNNQATFQLITSIVGRQRFKPGEVSRTRLLAWMNDPRISSPVLNVATAAIASRSMAEGVDLTMILPARASDGQRAQLRDRFASAWSISPTSGPGGEQSAWNAKVREVIAETKRTSTSIESLAQAAAFARLNLAAGMRWTNRSDEATSVLARSSSGAALMSAMALGGVDISVARAAEEQPRWALQLLTEDRTVAARISRLRDMESSGGGTLSQMDADVVIELACTSGAHEIRKAAQSAILQFSASPVTMNALLKVLPRVPRNAGVGDFIEKITGGLLGPMSREDWMLNARRAAVDRLLELMAGASASAAIDALAADMADTYAEINGEGSASPGILPPERLRMQAERQYRKLRAEAERFVPNDRAPVRLDAIDARRDARRSLAVGPVQAFAVEQIAIIETMAYVITGEKPTTAPAVSAVLAELTVRRRASNDILEQVRMSEEAMVRLWALRLGEDLP